jgi:signal transduction histidine kinase/ligand-binding sensor protein
MGWEHWPFYPRSLTDMIGPYDIGESSERFVSLFVSGYGKQLGRPFTVLEPELDRMGEPIKKLDPERPEDTNLKLRRIDQFNPHEHFTPFCDKLRALPGQDEACKVCDVNIARLVFRAATEQPEMLKEFATGYSCRMNLIDQAGVIWYHQTPVAVVLSGQFLPDDDSSRKKLYVLIGKLLSDHEITDKEEKELRTLVKNLETRTEFINRYVQGRSSDLSSKDKAELTVNDLFLQAVKGIEQIACAQFQMNKRDREGRFVHALREKIPYISVMNRQLIAEGMQLILEEVQRFCGNKYLALFISPRQYISYEGNPNLLDLFMSAGVEDEVIKGILHFNWHKSQSRLSEVIDSNKKGYSNPDLSSNHSFISLMKGDIQRAIKNCIKGENASFFYDTTLFCRLQLSDTYQAILLWGPFAHLNISSLEEEIRFLEEISELVMMRVLSSVQLADSAYRTEVWEDVAGLLSHYSRRAMNPVSTGVKIISDYLRGETTYSRKDAEAACESLGTASKVISQAVRSPLASFAATSEKTYTFLLTSLDIIVHDCVAHYLPMALEKQISIKIDSSVSSLPQIEVDKQKIGTAIENVVENAIKYSHRNKEIRIKGELSGAFVRLTIEDFGLGIKDEDRRLIFGREYQGERSKKALYEEGNGLGLFHTRLIVDAHKGKIWCECRSGSRVEGSAKLEGYRVWFTFELPISN